MIVTRKDGKWRVTVQLYGESWRAEKLKDNGERADNKLAVTLNKEQFEEWKTNAKTNRSNQS
ncbi:hypothetical protein [Candidatus Erwinia dacicola]|uniref:Uncharacterized protein n=1 Tax=Candidatus Erwinia dacicola TaxID=252393 RepID=A0A328TQV1_9GAMM|nr:hypothetical protein [Candidatus Erwinia dacicola]RAP72997.1 hypothetical protein ACZ87_00186 [Candidatus Erwinia dacicola]